MTSKTKKAGLELLREPFPANQISKLPKPTKFQTDAVKANYKEGVRCQVCNGWHHPKVVHLDYVGHAALTDRLLDSDPKWNWEPVAVAEDGTPKLDSIGGMWIRLTVCEVTRLGYGFADGKTGGNALKETIGDALRNAAIRFGAALDLWHKGELHADTEDKPEDEAPPSDDNPFDETDYDPAAEATRLLDALKHTADVDLARWNKTNGDTLRKLKAADRTQYENVLAECKDRAARISKEEAA